MAPATPSPEASRLRAILKECGEKLNVRQNVLSHPTHSMLMPEYQRLQDEMETARTELNQAQAAYRKYRKAHPG